MAVGAPRHEYAAVGQRLDALDRANAVRLGRARQKRRIRAGELSVADVLLDPAACDLGWPVGDLLMVQRRWGPARAARLLGRQQVSWNRPVGRLTDRQRQVLAGLLRDGTTR